MIVIIFSIYKTCSVWQIKILNLVYIERVNHKVKLHMYFIDKNFYYGIIKATKVKGEIQLVLIFDFR